MLYLPIRHITVWREDMHANLTETVARGGGVTGLYPTTPKREWQNAFPPNATWHGGLSRLPRAQKAHLSKLPNDAALFDTSRAQAESLLCYQSRSQGWGLSQPTLAGPCQAWHGPALEPLRPGQGHLRTRILQRTLSPSDLGCYPCD